MAITQINRLKIACMRRGITMKSLAQQLGVSETKLSLMSTGKRIFHYDIRAEAATILRCDPADLLPDEQAATVDDAPVSTSSVA